eukprot:g743.t1
MKKRSNVSTGDDGQISPKRRKINKFKLSTSSADANFEKVLYAKETTIVKCYVENIDGSPYYSTKEIPIDIYLVYAPEDYNEKDISPGTICTMKAVKDNPITVVNQSNPFIAENGVGNFEIQINTLSMDHKDQKFCLCFKLAGEEFKHVNAVISSPIQTVEYKLVISKSISDMCGNKENENVFYKDQGGKLRTMNCVIQLQQRDGGMCLHEAIPLKLMLCYEDKSIVANQSFLSISQDIEKLQIENGFFHLKFRVEDVSKNHGKRMFRVLVSPGDLQSSRRCAPVYTAPVLIKSKKNKAKQHTNLEDLTASSLNAFSIASDPNGNMAIGNETNDDNSDNNNNATINALGLNTYKMEERLRRQINAGKMNMNLAASALIEYSAKTTMCMNAMVQIQKQFQTEFRKYVEPSINFIVDEIQRQQRKPQPLQPQNTDRKSENQKQQHNFKKIAIDASNTSLTNDQIVRPTGLHSRENSLVLFGRNNSLNSDNDLLPSSPFRHSSISSDTYQTRSSRRSSFDFLVQHVAV